MSVQDATHRQVVPQLALLHLQRRLRQVELGDGEPWDGVVQVEAKGHQPDVDVCSVWEGGGKGQMHFEPVGSSRGPADQLPVWQVPVGSLPVTYSLTWWTLLMGLLPRNMYRLKCWGSLPTRVHVLMSGVVHLQTQTVWSD